MKKKNWFSRIISFFTKKRKKQYLSSPYQVVVTNPTDKPLTLTLFGRNEYLLSTNFGSSIELVVNTSQTNTSYLMLLQQSAEQPFETKSIRIQSSNNVQVQQILSTTITDANGQSATFPIDTPSYFSEYQEEKGFIDVPIKIRINAKTSISTLVLPNTTVTYTFFHKSI